MSNLCARCHATMQIEQPWCYECGAKLGAKPGLAGILDEFLGESEASNQPKFSPSKSKTTSQRTLLGYYVEPAPTSAKFKWVWVGIALAIVVLLVLVVTGCSSSPAQPVEPPQQSVPAPPLEESAPQVEGIEPQIPSEAIDWTEARQHVGQTVTVYETVAGTHFASGSNGRPTFINIGVDHPNPNRVTLVIWEEYRGNFPSVPETLYSGKTIVATGLVELHEGVVDIRVESPTQIQIIE